MHVDDVVYPYHINAAYLAILGASNSVVIADIDSIIIIMVIIIINFFSTCLDCHVCHISQVHLHCTKRYRQLSQVVEL